MFVLQRALVKWSWSNGHLVMVIWSWSFGQMVMVIGPGAPISDNRGQDDGHGRDEEQRERD